jgi:hypothetical protein
MTVVLPHVTPGERVHISASTYVAWKKCPDQANSRLQGIYGPDSKAAFVGSLTHRVISRHLNGGPISPEEFDLACKQEIGGSKLNNRVSTVAAKPSLLTAAIEEARALYERFVKFPTTGFEGSEVEIVHEPAEGVTLKGTIDAVYVADRDGHRLVDWKTGEIGDSDDQLSIYAFLWALDRGEIPVSVEAISIKTGDVHRSELSEGDVQAVAVEVGDMVSQVRSVWSRGGGFERRAGPWCRYCPILEECPEGQAAQALID